jgi:hypothetical protein
MTVRGRGPLAARELHRVAALFERGYDFVAMLALNLDRPILDRATAAAQPLQGAGEILELGLGGVDSVDLRDGLAATPLRLAANAHHAVAARRARTLGR